MLRCMILFIALALAANAHAEEPKVLASIKPLQLIAAAVLDGIAEPEVLLPVGASPHSYALRPSERRALEQAERIYWIGPEMELFLERLLSTRNNEVRMMHAAGVTLRALNDSHESEHEHAEHGEEHHQEHGHHDHQHTGIHDAHIWLSPANAVAMARTIAADLARLKPQHSEQLSANLARFEQGVAQLDSQLQARFAPLADRPYFVFHDGYGYFEDHFGLQARGIFSLSHEVQPGARHIAALRKELQRAGPSCVFSEPQFTPRLIQSLTAELPVRSAELDPLGGSAPIAADGYVHFMQVLGDNLAGCLEQL